MLKTSLLGGVSLLAMTTQASAAPLAPFALLGINALLGTSLTAETVLFTLGGTAVTAGSITGGFLSLGAALGAQFILGGGGGRGSLDTGTYKNTFESKEGGRIRAVGRVQIGGQKIYGNTSGYLTFRYIALCADPIDGIEEVFLGGRSVVAEDDGAISSPPFASGGSSHVFVLTKLDAGTTTTWPNLVTYFPSHWDSSRPGNGFAQALVQYVSPGVASPKLLKVRPSGWPEPSFVARVGAPYDPRIDDYAWTENAILICLHIALLDPLKSLSDFNLDIISDEADKADATVAKRGGTEPRARLACIWRETEESLRETLNKAMVSAGIEMTVDADGKYAFVLIDDNRDGELTLAERNILSDSFEGGPEGVERYNKCRVSYYSAERNYTVSEIPMVDNPSGTPPVAIAWTEIADEISRYGERVLDIQLPFCPSAAQAQRIARRLFANARADRLSITTNMAGMAVWYAQTFDLPSDYVIGASTIEIISAEADDIAGRVTINGFVQPTLTAWNTSTDEALPPPALPDVGYDPEIAAPSAATLSCVVTYPDTTKHTRIKYPDPGAAYTVEGTYRDVSGVSPGSWTSMSEWRASSGASHAYTSNDLTGVDIEFRHRIFNAEDDGSNWSTVTAFTPAVVNTTPGTPGLSVVNVPASGEVAAHADLTITAPDDLHISYLFLQWSGTGVETEDDEAIITNPGAVFTRTITLAAPGVSEKTANFSVIACTTDGTAGTAATYTITIPAA